VPLVYGGAKWIYRRFRKTDPTIQERILKAVAGKPAVFFVQVGSNDGVQGDPIHDLIVSRESWRGIFIEPIDFLFQRLRKNYGEAERFVFENVAIALEILELPSRLVRSRVAEEDELIVEISEVLVRRGRANRSGRPHTAGWRCRRAFASW